MAVQIKRSPTDEPWEKYLGMLPFDFLQWLGSYEDWLWWSIDEKSGVAVLHAVDEDNDVVIDKQKYKLN